MSVRGTLDVIELQDDEGVFAVVEIIEDKITRHVELAAVAALARLRDTDIEAYEHAWEGIELLLERGAPIDGLDG